MAIIRGQILVRELVFALKRRTNSFDKHPSGQALAADDMMVEEATGWNIYQNIVSNACYIR